ncbi:hypothetical protein BOW51_12365 [Solemya velesiana gill symbiont]|uniref:Uncharacterized protein n=1 Tax=Solemya velesiana gill symbiont TaxID=1918948 RepID=A0A1T2KMJ5_9GAMM|nr:hypothetical protein BOW51_12365 [Solemya velesiana gill symbiont]
MTGIINRMDHTADAREIASELREIIDEMGNRIRITETIIPSTVIYRKAATAQVPAHRWEPKRSGPTPSALVGHAVNSATHSLPYSPRQ